MPLPISITLVVVQVSVPPAACAPGTSTSSSTVVLALLLQPLAAVTVRVYTPAVLTTGAASALTKPLGPVHWKLTMPGAKNPFRVTVGLLQESTPLRASTSGTSLSNSTSAVAVLVQPLAPVTTRV